MSIAKLLDPIFFIFALIAVFLLRSWWGTILVGVVLACVYQVLLGDSRGYAFAAAVIAMMTQAWVAFGIFCVVDTTRGRSST
jgi:hypothetical protein